MSHKFKKNDLGTCGQRDKGKREKGTKDHGTNGPMKNNKKKMHFQNHFAIKRPENIFWAKIFF